MRVLDKGRVAHHEQIGAVGLARLAYDFQQIIKDRADRTNPRLQQTLRPGKLCRHCQKLFSGQMVKQDIAGIFHIGAILLRYPGHPNRHGGRATPLACSGMLRATGTKPPGAVWFSAAAHSMLPQGARKAEFEPWMTSMTAG
ncbi:MAG: hypothetical protein JJU09_13195 [Rhodobacteraceae bacterium]|nr:hypothetical protein [Paracoccaceae bacterium]MCC5967400.1 hypothetical protein [Natronohydrobacter sp.]